jgi:hypothetical protein
MLQAGDLAHDGTVRHHLDDRDGPVGPATKNHVLEVLEIRTLLEWLLDRHR